MNRALRATACLLTAGCMGCSVSASKKHKPKPDTSATSNNDNVEDALGEILDKGLEVSFLSPGEKDLEAAGTFEIKVKFSNLDPSKNGTWSLYVTSSVNSIEDGSRIAHDLATTETKVLWDASEVSFGIYYFYAIVKQSEESAIGRSIGGVIIGDAPSDGRTPVVKFDLRGNFRFLDVQRNGDGLIDPDNRSTYRTLRTDRNPTVPIRWIVTDPDGQSMRVKISYSSDAGATWNLIQEDISDKVNQLDWAVPQDAPETARYLLRISVNDEDNRESHVVSGRPFGISHGPYNFQNTLNQVFLSACGPCHAAGQQNAGTFRADLFNDGSVDNDVRDRRDRIFETTLSSPIRGRRAMPPANHVATMDPEILTSVRDAIYLWYTTGAN